MHSPHKPIHHRDFLPMREQAPLRSVPTDAKGQVRFVCLDCARSFALQVSDLLARFGPDAGLVNVLNASLPETCRGAPDDPGRRHCGLHYRDLRRTPAPAPTSTLERTPGDAMSAPSGPPNSAKNSP